MATKKTTTKTATKTAAKPASAPAARSAPAEGDPVVLDGVRYVVAGVEGAGGNAIATLHAPDGAHDRVTQCRAADLEQEPTFGVWTIPGRLLAGAGPATGAVLASDARGNTAVSPLTRVAGASRDSED